MSNLHELTKQLDVLTWNSRSVLNALVRSAMAAGSHDGFTVTRAGVQVKLDKMDIFAIYHFYEEWAAEGYPSGDAFMELVNKHDQQYSGSAVVTNALSKHAQIMWMDMSNVDNKNNPQYWLDRLSSVTNPKWLTNTAPIPLNIRTPIYDENLSTKTYDSYETYLFPSGYYSIDTLGYRGDGMSHTAGGKEWMFDLDDKLHVLSNHVLLGDQSERRIADYKNAYDMDQTQGYALEGGSDCFALADNSFSYGESNIVSGDNSAILGGVNNAVYSYSSGVFAGENNDVLNQQSVVCGGDSNKVSGITSFAANANNYVGGYSYPFQRSVKTDNAETECQSPITLNGCTYTRAESGIATSADGLISLGTTQVFIAFQSVVRSGMILNHISSGDNMTESSPFDFKVGDTVVISDLLVRSYDDNGDVRLGTGALSANVVNIESAKVNGTSGALLGYIVTLDKSIDTKNIPALDYRAVKEGRISKTSSYNYPVLTEDGKLDKYIEKYITRDCTVFGYNNIATGYSQTVVGASCIELERPMFIIGSGSSYVQQINDGERRRDISFVSAHDYTYQKTTQYVVSGVSTYTTAYIHGDFNDEITEQMRQYDEDYNSARVEKYEGFFAYATSPTDDKIRAVLRVNHKKSLLAINDNGLELTSPFATQKHSALNNLYSTVGSVAISSSDTKTRYEWIGYQKSVVDTAGPTDTRAVTIWGKDMVAIYGDKVRIDTKHGITFNGTTMDTLTAQPSSENGLEPHLIQGYIYLDTFAKTGHYYIPKTRSGFTASDADLGKFFSNPHYMAYHVFESSKGMTDEGEYDVAQIIIPGALNTTCTRWLRGTSDIPHPLICVNHVYNGTNDRYQTGTKMICEQLAYMSDITNTRGGTICYNKGVPAYAAFVDSAVQLGYYTDSTPDVSYAGNTYFVQDTFLYSLYNLQSNVEYAETASPVTVAPNSEYAEKIIRTSAFPNYAGQAVNMQQNSKSLYLNGVELNPVMNIVYRSRSNNKISGIGYLAYGPAEIPFNDTLGQEYKDQKDIYTNQVGSTTPTGWYANNLYTSKFSRGTSSTVMPTNMRDVWFTDRDGTVIRWKRLMRDLHVTFAGGHLSVEFKLSGYAMKYGALAYVKGITDTSDPLYGYPVVNGNDKSNVGDKTIIITLPIDPLLGNHMTNLVNASTNVAAQMYGHMYHESDGVNEVDLTGIYGNQISMPLYNPEEYPVATPYLYNVPCVQITIRQDQSFNSEAWYFCHLEGVVNYVD